MHNGSQLKACWDDGRFCDAGMTGVFGGAAISTLSLGVSIITTVLLIGL